MRKVKLTRFKGNPLLKPIPGNKFEAQNVSNAGVTEYKGKIYILYRAEGFEKRVPYTKDWPVTRLGLAISSDGYTIEKRLKYPVIDKDKKGEFGEHGIQDPRIAKIKDTYYITTAGVGRWGDRTILFSTKDFKSFKRIGVLQPEHEMRTAGMFPQKFGEYFCFLLRYTPNMWISYTKDFKVWKNTKLMLQVKKHSWYGRKLGLGATPIRQKNAWLLFWHGKDDTLEENYSLGIMWLDLKDPSKILKIQEEPILTVKEPFEKKGYWPNVVYTCGAIEKDGKYLVYYGATDRVLALATVPVEQCILK